ncbi:hypothetical protein [Streptomyces sp. KL118A]|uniref:hypothetical protein n=1 Tax=Streptomyces sp. KL118A TaxID=3045153 RepID=UPI00278BAF0B|nr:hypothetical protein [Streptomyces sp. KL118A]
MEPGDYIAAGSALVAAAAAGIASWQVLVAKQASRASDLQARAALGQVELLREQFAQERALLDQADCPVFAVRETAVDRGNGGPDIVAVVLQTGGSPVAEARVTAHLNDEPAEIIDADDDGVLSWRHTAPGATRTLKIRTSDRHRGELEIRVDLHCRESDDGRTWACRVIGYAREDWRRETWHAGHMYYRNRPGDQSGSQYHALVAAQGTVADEDRGPGGTHPEDRGLLSVTPVAVMDLDLNLGHDLWGDEQSEDEESIW